MNSTSLSNQIVRINPLYLKTKFSIERSDFLLVAGKVLLVYILTVERIGGIGWCYVAWDQSHPVDYQGVGIRAHYVSITNKDWRRHRHAENLKAQIADLLSALI